MNIDKANRVIAVPIQEVEGYMINSDGKIFSLKRDPRGREIKQHAGNSGYLKVSFSIKTNSGCRTKNYMTHRLVAKYFLGECPEGYQVNHKDGDKLNNKASNLEYVTQYENMTHARDFGLLNPPKGERNHNSKLTESDVDLVRNLWVFNKAQILSVFMGVDESTIRRILRGDNWKN